MNPFNHNPLTEILDNAIELRNWSTAGGKRQYSYEVAIDTNILETIATMLQAELDRIHDEYARDIYED